jgi:putative peptidoglycan lipid II flippase
VFIAARFGADVETDAYFVARLIPVGLWIVLGNALNVSFIPAYMRTLAEDDKDAAARLANDFLSLTLWISLILALAYIFFADRIIPVLAPGFPADTQRLTVTLTQIMAFVMVFLGLYGVLDSILNAGHRYILSALSSLWRPIGALVGVLVLADFWQMPGVAIGVLLGAALQFATVVPGMRGKLARKTISIDLRNPRLKEALKRVAIVLIVVATGQINYVVDRVIASLAGEGAVSVFGFGFALVSVFPVLVAMPVYKVLYPVMLRLVAAVDQERLRELFSWNIFFVAFITFPITALLMCFPIPVTELAFQHGHFSAMAVTQTADVIMFLSLALCPTISSILATYYFLATSRTKLLLLLMVVSIALNAGLGYGLMHMMGVAGVALSSSVGAMVRLGILLVFLRKAIGGLDGARMIGALTKLAVATVLTGTVLHFIPCWLPNVVGTLGPIVAGSGLAVVGLAMYLSLNVLFRNEQNRSGWRGSSRT